MEDRDVLYAGWYFLNQRVVTPDRRVYPNGTRVQVVFETAHGWMVQSGDRIPFIVPASVLSQV